MSENKGDKSADGLFEGILEALADKHSQLDINLQNVALRLPNAGVSVEVSGLVTVTAHVRDLTEDERRASSTRNVAIMSHT
jgi:hypothetical protein